MPSRGLEAANRGAAPFRWRPPDPENHQWIAAEGQHPLKARRPRCGDDRPPPGWSGWRWKRSRCCLPDAMCWWRHGRPYGQCQRRRPAAPGWRQAIMVVASRVDPDSVETLRMEATESAISARISSIHAEDFNGRGCGLVGELLSPRPRPRQTPCRRQPARAASMVALSARRLEASARLRMISVTVPMRSEAALSCEIVPSVRDEAPDMDCTLARVSSDSGRFPRRWPPVAPPQRRC